MSGIPSLRAGLLLVLTLACDARPREQPVGVDCAAHPVCGESDSVCTGRRTCFSLLGCALPVCLEAQLACEQSCGGASCQLLETYPVGLRCGGREPAMGRNGDEQERANEPSTEDAGMGSGAIDDADPARAATDAGARGGDAGPASPSDGGAQ